MTILLVDDLKEYVDSLSRILGRDHRVIPAYSLEQAKKAMNESVALALVDIRLSDVDPANRDGIILLAWLKEHFPSVPVVIMSAYRDFDAAADAVNLGAAYYLKKPINLAELQETIVRLGKPAG